jgi:hypothetical protein
MTEEHHDTVVVDGGGGSGVGMIVGIIAAVLIVLALIWYFGFANNAGRDTNININPPDLPAVTAAP